MKNWRSYKKTLVALVGVIVTLVSALPVPDRWQPFVSAVIGLLTAAGVYNAKNVPPTEGGEG